MWIIIFLLVAIIANTVKAHGRWLCPLARDEKDENGQHISFDNTGNKYAACGPMSGKWGFGSVTSLSPGCTTVLTTMSLIYLQTNISFFPNNFKFRDNNSMGRIHFSLRFSFPNRYFG